MRPLNTRCGRFSLPDSAGNGEPRRIPEPPPVKGNGMEKSHGLKHFFQACRYSADGLRYAIREAAFRQELIIGVITVPLARILPVPVVMSLLLTLAWLGLLVVEILNTAIEAVVDLASPERHPLAKQAKDLASAAVTIAIVANILAWATAICQCLQRSL